MSELDYSAAFAENEKEANLYAARCMRVLAVVVSVIWVMNLLHLFIVPPVIMAIAAIGGIVLFLIPTLLLHLIDRDSPRLKLYILLCCILGITLMSSALPKHAIMAWYECQLESEPRARLILSHLCSFESEPPKHRSLNVPACRSLHSYQGHMI